MDGSRVQGMGGDERGGEWMGVESRGREGTRGEGSVVESKKILKIDPCAVELRERECAA